LIFEYNTGIDMNTVTHVLLPVVSIYVLQRVKGPLKGGLLNLRK